MNLNDIRPGDFVRIGDTRVAWKPEFYFKWDATGRIPIGYSEGNNTRPLELTYNFLKSNGFIDFDTNTTVLYTVDTQLPVAIEVYAELTATGYDLTIYKYIIEEDRFETIYCNEIKYIHELQHAFKECKLRNELKLD